ADADLPGVAALRARAGVVTVAGAAGVRLHRDHAALGLPADEPARPRRERSRQVRNRPAARGAGGDGPQCSAAAPPGRTHPHASRPYRSYSLMPRTVPAGAALMQRSHSVHSSTFSPMISRAPLFAVRKMLTGQTSTSFFASAGSAATAASTCTSMNMPAIVSVPSAVP